MKTCTNQQKLFHALRTATVCGLALTFSACINAKISKEEVAELDASIAGPERNITRYDESLENLGMMLMAYGEKPVVIKTREIANYTGSKKPPKDLSQMVFTALNKVGEKITATSFSKDDLAIDLALQEKTMQRVVPDLDIIGGVTQFDKVMEKEKEFEGNKIIKADGGEIDLGGSLDGDAKAVTIGMDFQMLKYRTQTSIPNVMTANRIDIFEDTKGIDFGLAYKGSGFGINSTVKRAQGMHSALRLLVELSMVELLGEYYMVPYWQCVPGMPEDTKVIDRYRKELRRMKDKVPEIKKLAFAHGKPMDLFTDSFSETEELALKDLKTSLGLSPSAKNDESFAVAMWKTVPFRDAAERMRTYEYAKEDKEAEDAALAAEAQRQAEIAAAAQAQAEAEAAAAAAQAEAEHQHNQRTIFKMERDSSF